MDSAGQPTGNWAAMLLRTASRFRRWSALGIRSVSADPTCGKIMQRPFREDFPGESVGRTNLRGQGLFNIDSGLYKNFTMPWSEHQKLQFRWESYNLTN